MIAFVILHYRAIHNTMNCVKHIRALWGNKHVVIVDNASPDGTGLQLYRQYRNSKDVTVLLNGENAGFARGNNLGIRWAKDHLQPDFIVVLNDDVEIRQQDFIERIGAIYHDHPFDLLGPDIVSVFSGIHQSPKILHGHTLETVLAKQEYVKKSCRTLRMLLSCGEKNSPAIWRIAQQRQRARQRIDSSVAMEGVVLHGSCVIFSKRYLNCHPEPFFPGTFMYFEMEILEWLCRQEGNVIRYDPALSVLHHQYVATRMEYPSIISQSKFVASCLSDSLIAAEKLMREAEEKCGVCNAEEKSKPS